MRKVVLFIAMSLDGYIATTSGQVDWLKGQDPAQDDANLQTYDRFIQGVDTVVMGRRTYDQIATELFPDAWPYADLTTYVSSHRPHANTANITFTAVKAAELISQLRQQPGQNIWLCGGANLINQYREADLIDRYHISVIPTLLGTGIRLFVPGTTEQPLKLIASESYNGITDLIYERR